MKLRKNPEGIDRIDLNHKIIEMIRPAIESIVRLKLDNRDTAKGLVSRYTEADFEDLVQLGMLGVWEALHMPGAYRYPIAWDALMRNAKTAMNRGGKENFKISGKYSIQYLK